MVSSFKANSNFINMSSYSHEESPKTVALPIAIGPCMLFKRWDKRPSQHGPGHWFRSLVVGSKRDQVRRVGDQGQWVDSFLTLYSDSTMSLREGTGDKNRVVASIKLVDVYRKLQFGEDVSSLAEPPPTTGDRDLGSLLAVPSDPHCNSEMTWLFFFSQHTLNKWLVAICKSIPAEKLIETRAGRQPWTHSAPPPALEKHIRLFFPLPEDEKMAGHCPHDQVRINGVQPAQQQQQKHQPPQKQQQRQQQKQQKQKQPKQKVQKRGKKAPRYFGGSAKSKSKSKPM